GSAGIAREGEPEPRLELAAGGPGALALELQRRRGRDPGGSECARIGGGIMAFQHEEGEPFPALQKGLVEGAEQFRETLAGELLRLRDRQQLDEESGEF